MSTIATIDGRAYTVAVENPGTVSVDGRTCEVDLESIDGGFHYSLLVGSVSYEVFVERREDICFVTIEGQRYQVHVEDERLRRLAGRTDLASSGGEEPEVTSPMPGVVVAVLVQDGQSVKTGEGLAILEAMKMENEIRSPRNGIIAEVRVTPGQSVGQGDTLIRFEAPGK